MNKKNNMTTMRIDNTISILKILYENGPLSRSDISRMINLSSSAVTSITKELKNRNFIEEHEPIKKKNLGRPVKPLAINDKHIYILGLNISGEEKIELSAFNLYLEKKEKLNLNLDNFKADCIADKIIAAYQNLIKKMPEDSEFIGLGISISGIIDKKENIYFSETLNWSNVNLKSKLSQEIDIPIFIERDVNALATYEYMKAENSMDLDPFAEIVIGRGIGLGMIIDGKVFSGHLAGGEISHITTIESDFKQKCRCGKINCISTILSRKYLEERILNIKDYNKIDLEIQKKIKNEPLTYLNESGLEKKEIIFTEFVEAVSKLLKIITEMNSPKEIIINSSYQIPLILKEKIQKQYLEKVFLPKEMINQVIYRNHLSEEWNKGSAAIVLQNLLYNYEDVEELRSIF